MAFFMASSVLYAIPGKMPTGSGGDRMDRMDKVDGGGDHGEPSPAWGPPRKMTPTPPASDSERASGNPASRISAVICLGSAWWKIDSDMYRYAYSPRWATSLTISGATTLKWKRQSQRQGRKRGLDKSSRAPRPSGAEQRRASMKNAGRLVRL